MTDCSTDRFGGVAVVEHLRLNKPFALTIWKDQVSWMKREWRKALAGQRTASAGHSSGAPILKPCEFTVNGAPEGCPRPGSPPASRCAGSRYPQVRVDLSKLTVTTPFALSAMCCTSCMVMAEPSEPASMIVSVNVLFAFCWFMLKLPHRVRWPV